MFGDFGAVSNTSISKYSVRLFSRIDAIRITGERNRRTEQENGTGERNRRKEQENRTGERNRRTEQKNGTGERNRRTEQLAEQEKGKEKI